MEESYQLLQTKPNLTTNAQTEILQLEKKNFQMTRDGCWRLLFWRTVEKIYVAFKQAADIFVTS